MIDDVDINIKDYIYGEWLNLPVFSNGAKLIAHFDGHGYNHGGGYYAFPNGELLPVYFTYKSDGRRATNNRWENLRKSIREGRILFNIDYDGDTGVRPKQINF